MKRFFTIFSLCVLAIASSYAGDKTGKDAGAVKIRIQNVVDGKNLVLNTQSYTNAHGDTFTIRMYKYYISNIRLVKENGEVFAEDDSYHLVNEAKSKTKEFTINNIPEGKYTAISFMIGVDSLHNVSGAQSGDLDPINAMFWDWNTGYIMAKIEGNRPNGEELAFHIGGFVGKNSVLRNVTIPLDALTIGKGKVPVINLESDIAEWFQSPVIVDFSKTPAITMEGKEATEIADNYADMFSLKTIEQ